LVINKKKIRESRIYRAENGLLNQNERSLPQYSENAWTAMGDRRQRLEGKLRGHKNKIWGIGIKHLPKPAKLNNFAH